MRFAGDVQCRRSRRTRDVRCSSSKDSLIGMAAGAGDEFKTGCARGAELSDGEMIVVGAGSSACVTEINLTGSYRRSRGSYSGCEGDDSERVDAGDGRSGGVDG